jgi:hydroxysqualene synthase
VVADDQAAAYAYCLQLAREHYENFPVASRLLPSAMRPHVAAVYAFARKADDFADEPGLQPDERLARLDDWHARLTRAVTTGPAGRSGDDLIFAAVGESIRTLDLPVSLFEDLLSAFRQDVTTKRYETWPDVLDYCRRSANPVGRLVLRIAGYRGIELDRQSDAICTALQLTNFWQDLERDWRIGRIYAPRVDRERFGARETDLEARRLTSEWRQLMSELVTRTRALFDEGRPLMDALRGRLKWELRLTWLGGVRILDRLEVVGYDVFRSRPTLRSGDVPALAWQAARWRRGA